MTPTSVLEVEPQFDGGSFRDPEARVVTREGMVYRCLSDHALEDWTLLESTEFFRRFVEGGELVRTERVDDAALRFLGREWSGVLRHETVPVISYPFEWPFGMLKDAALLQLDLTLAALQEGMTLKDGTPYNVQWRGPAPVFIDIGSFTRYVEGTPWLGYRQFCQLFLYPLFLQAYKNVPYHPWLRGSLEGIDASHCKALLSPRDWLRRGVLAHVHLQAAAQRHFRDTTRNVRNDLRAAGFDRALIVNNLRRLRRTVERLEWSATRSTWSDYGVEHNYSDEDVSRKRQFVHDAVSSRRPRLVWDIGCNVGTYTRLAAEHADYVVGLDADHLTMHRLYLDLRREGRTNILPLLGDVADPSPALGWRGLERGPLRDRGAPDLILCLALIHHVTLGRNVPVAEFIEWLAGFGADVVVEFVSTDDPMVQRLTRNHSGARTDYSLDAVSRGLKQHFGSVTSEVLTSGMRTLFHARAARSAARSA